MATPAFRELVRLHAAALGDVATVYFRPTDKGLVRIVLHPAAPSFVGFRVARSDKGYLLRPGAALPRLDDLRGRFAQFEAWLPSVTRGSTEERAVIRWLRAALRQGLRLDGLEQGWVFLHQEWRFKLAEKSDVLAVHIPTGQLGICELKARAADLGKARQQVERYAEYWKRDVHALAAFFTQLLQALGHAYGHEDAANCTIRPIPAALFVGYPSEDGRMRLYRHEPSI